MLAIHYCRQDERTRRHTTQHSEVPIGRDAGNELVLADPTVSARHCRIVEKDGAWLVEDLGSAAGTVINGSRIQRPVVVGERDRIYVGAFVLELEELDGRIGPVEEGLLAGIARGDDNSRTIYADWLEEHGDVARAEFVRLQQALIEAPMMTQAQRTAFHAASERLRALAASIDVEWRMRVARPAVEGCHVAFELPCKMDWGALEPTDDPRVRTCNTCRSRVHYCTTEEEALAHAERRACIVLDVRQIGVACPACGRENMRRSSKCFGCGAMLAVTAPARDDGPMMLGRLPMRYSEPELIGAVIAVPDGPSRSCPGCGAGNPAIYRFCLTCGTHLGVT